MSKFKHLPTELKKKCPISAFEFNRAEKRRMAVEFMRLNSARYTILELAELTGIRVQTMWKWARQDGIKSSADRRCNSGRKSVRIDYDPVDRLMELATRRRG